MREAIDGGELCIAFREPRYESDYDEYQLVDTDNVFHILCLLKHFAKYFEIFVFDASLEQLREGN